MSEPKKKRPSRIVARASCTKEQHDTLMLTAQRRGLTFSGMVLLDYLGAEPKESVDTPAEALGKVVVQRLRDALLPVRPYIDDPGLLTPKDTLHDFMKAVIDLRDYANELRNERKRKPARRS